MTWKSPFLQEQLERREVALGENYHRRLAAAWIAIGIRIVLLFAFIFGVAFLLPVLFR